MTGRRRTATASRIAVLLASLVAAGAFLGLPAVSAQDSPPPCDLPAQSSAIQLSVTAPESSTASTITVSGTYRHTGTRPFPFDPPTVTSVRLELRTCVNGRSPDPVNVSAAKRQGSFEDVTFDLPYNGRYVLVATATGSDDASTTTSQIVDIVVPPRSPTEVSATRSDEGMVSLTWKVAAVDPDLVGFEIRRAPADATSFTGPGVVLDDPSLRAATDSPPTGAWKYAVRALRPGAAPAGTDGAYLGSADASSKTITIAATPSASTPTTQADGTGGAGAGGTGSGPGSGTSSSSSSSSSSTTGDGSSPTISGGTRNAVNITGLLNGRTTPTTLRRPAEPDPGFEETLPFDLDREVIDESPAEPGDAVGQALGEQRTSNPGERRRSLGFVAGGLLLFVLGMTGLFLKSEVRRADELDPLDPHVEPPVPVPPLAVEPEPEAAAPRPPGRRSAMPVRTAPTAVVVEPDPAPAAAPTRRPRRTSAGVTLPVTAQASAAPVVPAAVAAAPAAAPRRSARAEARAARLAELEAMFSGDDGPTTADDDARHLDRLRRHANRAARTAATSTSANGAATGRVRRTVAPVDAPALDVPDPAAATPGPATRTHARRAPTRVPPRPADDRRQSGPAVRPGRGGAGQGNRRLPVQ